MSNNNSSNLPVLQAASAFINETQQATLWALATDPVIQHYAKGNFHGLLDRRILEALARVAVTVLHKETPEMLLFGRHLLHVCFRPDWRPLGTQLCDRVFEAALAERKQLVQLESQRAADRVPFPSPNLSPSYDFFRNLGTPAWVCNRGVREARGPVERVEKIVCASLAGEERLARETRAKGELKDRCFFDVSDGKWFIVERGSWGKPISESAFKTHLIQLGLVPKAIIPFIGSTRSFRDEEIHPELDGIWSNADGIGVRNLFRPTDVEPRPGVFPDIFKVFHWVCNGDPGFTEYVFDWAAFALQELYPQLSSAPWNRDKIAQTIQTQIALVFTGVQGAGKDTMGAILAALFGEHHSAVLDQNGLDGKFKGQLVRSLFVYCSEVISTTNRFAESANFMKAMIAGDKIALEEKYKTPVKIAARMNVVVASNDDAPVIVEKNDRRYVVKRSTQKLPKDIADRVWADLKGPRRQLSAFFNFLLNRKSKFYAGKMYETPDREEMQQAAAPSEEKFVRAIVEDGWIAICGPWVDDAPTGQMRAPTAQTDKKGDFVLASTLAAVYRHWSQLNGVKPRGATKMYQALKGLPGVTNTRERVGGTQLRGYFGLPMKLLNPVQEVAKVEPEAHPNNVDYAGRGADVHPDPQGAAKVLDLKAAKPTGTDKKGGEN